MPPLMVGHIKLDSQGLGYHLGHAHARIKHGHIRALAGSWRSAHAYALGPLVNFAQQLFIESGQSVNVLIESLALPEAALAVRHIKQLALI